jgi:hypothetical protein
MVLRLGKFEFFLQGLQPCFYSFCMLAFLVDALI